jgi:hypothetical protein
MEKDSDFIFIGRPRTSYERYGGADRMTSDIRQRKGTLITVIRVVPQDPFL